MAFGWKPRGAGSVTEEVDPRFDVEWRARFERFGRSHHEDHAVSGWSAEGLARRLKVFRGLVGELPLEKGSRVLELGCGAGTYVRYLTELGHHVIGVDYAIPSLERATAADRKRLACYVAADGYELPFAPSSFDLVVCIGVLQALSRPERLIDQIAGVLRPHGLVVVEVLNALGPGRVLRQLRQAVGRRPGRVRFFRPSEVVRWLAQGDIRLTRRIAVHLPPRRYPALGRALDSRAVRWLLEAVSARAPLTAHAFWLVGEKAAGGRGGVPVALSLAAQGQQGA
jgi:SAM-dependent methyltransferase